MEKYMKKFWVTVLAILCIAFAGTITACAQPVYYELSFNAIAGVTMDSEIKPGAIVLDGYTVKFGLAYDDTMYGGDPVVTANGNALTADNDGKYSFVMKANTEIKVTGLEKIRMYDVAFSIGKDVDGGDARISYSSPNGDTTTGFEVLSETEVTFSLKVSSFYQQDVYQVLANTEILTPDEDGNYKITVIEDTTISVSNLTQEVNFLERKDGTGTAYDPYIIRRPIDFYYMAAIINNSFFQGSGYYLAHYELANDIDMGGEQIFIIGDQTSESAFFGGTFNGNGHTVSNFYIEDTMVDVESYQEFFMPYIGMFGLAAASTNGSALIYNLHLSDYTINVDASKHGSMFAAGGIVGYSIGANVIGCSVTNARIVADADVQYFGYVGGIVGFHQSAYSSDEVRFYATIRSCSANNVSISGQTGHVLAAGGIAGYLMSYEEKTTAFILNCYSSGAISGAMNAGGIAGMTSGDTSILGCYSTATVVARSTINDLDNTEFWYANAGGIVGFMDYSSIIADSFSVGTQSASADKGNQYALTNGLVARTNKESAPNIDSREPIMINSYALTQMPTKEYMTDTLKWSDKDWVFTDGQYPTLNMQETSKTFTITVNYDGKTVNSNSSLK